MLKLYSESSLLNNSLTKNEFLIGVNGMFEDVWQFNLLSNSKSTFLHSSKSVIFGSL